ncbi:MAG: phage portal protein [Oscillospiraceae bacterium]|nr:phage portal protein [Oscillospiraceae bacterium]
MTENYINESIRLNAPMNEVEIWENEIRGFLLSPEFRAMKTADDYFDGRHDILNRRRTAIGDLGRKMEIENLPNNRIVDNQYRKAVTQKCNYLAGKPFVFETENLEFSSLLKETFDRAFYRLVKNIALDSINCGIGWLHLYYDEFGKLRFRRFPSSEIIPLWKDAEHTELDVAIRVFDITTYEARQRKIVTKVHVYTRTGIEYFEYRDGKLIAEFPFRQAYISRGSDEYNWQKVPIIAFKRNSDLSPLINNVKSLQDALNAVISDFMNNMQEDARNTILVIKNYDGENLAEFRRNLALFGAVKVRTVEGSEGGVGTLNVEVNADNYKQLIEILRRSIIENCMAFDAKSERLGGNPNQINIRSMYSDIDLDANETETEFCASMERVVQFLIWHFNNVGNGNFEGEEVSFCFDRDMIMNETEIIDGVLKSTPLLSQRTAIANHPYVKDVERELRWINLEKDLKGEKYV